MSTKQKKPRVDYTAAERNRRARLRKKTVLNALARGSFYATQIASAIPDAAKAGKLPKSIQTGKDEFEKLQLLLDYLSGQLDLGLEADGKTPEPE